MDNTRRSSHLFIQLLFSVCAGLRTLVIYCRNPFGYLILPCGSMTEPASWTGYLLQRQSCRSAPERAGIPGLAASGITIIPTIFHGRSRGIIHQETGVSIFLFTINRGGLRKNRITRYTSPFMCALSRAALRPVSSKGFRRQPFGTVFFACSGVSGLS
jgi:hypothetical protein